MKKLIIIISALVILISCQYKPDVESVKQEIFNTEKAFEQMVAEKGIAEGFYQFAAKDAVIKRENDTLIVGSENIRNYYSSRFKTNFTLSWTPESIRVSEDGTLAWTYGHYLYTFKTDSTVIERKGVFHTVWQKQPDKTWKYVWD